MKVKKLAVALGLEGILCAVLALAGPSGTNALPALLAFPFAQLGQGLRQLSLSGAAGNAAAVTLYAVLALLPLGLLAARYLRKKRLYWEDSLLAVLSALLFFVLYRMVNPGSIGIMFGTPELVDAGKAMLGGTVWSAVAAYLVLRALRAFGSGAEKLLRWLDELMAVLCMVLVWAAVWGMITGCQSGAAALEAGNTDVPGLSYWFVGLRALVDILPYLLELWVLFGTFGLSAAFAQDPYGPTVSGLAERLAGRCRISVTAVLLAQVALNLLQLVFSAGIRAADYQVHVPLFDLGVVLAVLLLARYLAQSRAIKEENDGFV